MILKKEMKHPLIEAGYPLLVHATLGYFLKVILLYIDSYKFLDQILFTYLLSYLKIILLAHLLCHLMNFSKIKLEINF